MTTSSAPTNPQPVKDAAMSAGPIDTLAQIREAAFKSEDDFLTLVDLTAALEALARMNKQPGGIEQNEAEGMYRVAILASDKAVKAQAVWERVFRLSTGGEA